jgi:hypothetical protein
VHFFGRRIKPRGIGDHRAGADAVHAKARHPGCALLGQGAELVTQPDFQRLQFAARGTAVLRLGGGHAARGKRGGACASGGKEFAAVHDRLLVFF